MLNKIKDYFKDSELEYSVYIKNLKTRESLAINENKRVLSASIIKLFIMGEAFNQNEKGVIDFESRVKIKSQSRIPYSIITMLNPDNSYTIRDLVTLMIVQSDNTATNMLIEMLGMDKIMDFIEELKLKDTLLNRRMLDYDARKKGLENITTAYETGTFLEKLYKGEIVSSKASNEMLEIMKLQLDNTMMRFFIPEEFEIAHKTGELEGVQHDAGIVYGGNVDYIAVFMTWNSKSNSCARYSIARAAEEVHGYMVGEIV